MSYVMDSKEENRRLREQAVADPVGPRLLRTGLSAGMAALDLGCGPGVTSRAMASVVGPSGRVVGLDRSAARIEDARRGAELPNLEFLEGDAFRLPFADGEFDYCWSQFVFEYFADRAPALRELWRVTRPGGTVVIADVDNSGFLNWPFPAELEDGLRKLEGVLRSTGFDPCVGRKLFAEMRALGFAEVEVSVEPHYVYAGAADARSLADWRTRFEALEGLAAPAFGGQAAYRAFAEAFLQFWASPDALKYSVLLVTRATRP